GFQKRFEKRNVENLAFVASLDYKLFRGAQLGGSFYYGDTSDNRPKPDLNTHAEVMIVGLHGFYEDGPWTLRGAGLYGHLNNSDLVSTANQRLSNTLNVKRSPVGAAALAWYVEAGFDLFHLIDNKSHLLGSRFDVFARYDNYNTMEDTDGLVFASGRWDRETWATGFNYHFIKGLMLKGEFAHRRVNIKDNNKEKTYSLGVAAEF
ncbi:MAG: hypothetical protein KAG66_22040, partial [Methylococcales bacterium]|nr:hypothetical protein [Methylococcales bacterium]